MLLLVCCCIGLQKTVLFTCFIQKHKGGLSGDWVLYEVVEPIFNINVFEPFVVKVKTYYWSVLAK